MARRRRRFARVLALLLLLPVGLLARDFLGIGGGSGTVTVTIPRGASTRAIAESLAANGVIRGPRSFRFYASLGDKDRAFKPGRFELERGSAWSDVVATLVGGRGKTVTIVIPEGFDLRDIVPLVAKSLDVPSDSVEAAVTDSAWRRRLDVPVATLEGYLFPATYTFAAGTSARDAVNAMLERFTQVWKPEWDTQARARSLTRHQVMTMAAIVEKEARVAEERPIISAVYWNRVQKRMRLQADPTVQYALPEHTQRVLYKDLDVESPYNTYRNDGLPPGPIASPGEASIVAALSPADVPYLFFVAHPDGHHEFRTTFAEHERAIAQVRRAARARPKP